MVFERIAGICCGIIVTSAVATGQQKSDTNDQGPRGPARSVIEGTYGAGNGASWRRVQTRSESGGREVVIETSDVPDIDGRLAPVEEIVVETIRTAPNTVQTRRDVLGFAEHRRRRLLETSESLQETVPNGDASVVHTTWVPDLDGRLGLTSRRMERTRSTTPDVRHTDTTLLMPNLNETLGETERTEYIERRISSDVIRHERTQLLRDLNGRWQPIETRRGEARQIGAERTEEETIHRPDTNGKLAIDERNVTRRFHANEQDHVVTETFGRDMDGLSRADSRLALTQRVHQTTMATADGGRYTVEEVEGRNPVAPRDPLRVIRRTVTRERQLNGGRWIRERQMFERDVNGRLQLVGHEVEEQTER